MSVYVVQVTPAGYTGGQEQGLGSGVEVGEIMWSDVGKIYVHV